MSSELLFNKEEDVIRNGEALLLVTPDQKTLLEAHARMVEDYKKLFSQTKRLVRMNDRHEAELSKKNKAEIVLRRQIEEYNLHLEQRVKKQVGIITQAQTETIFALSKLAESRDPETGAHLERIREYCKLLASALSKHSQYSRTVNNDYIENLYIASPLHDIGKVSIPDHILLKPGRHTDEEFAIMKTHAVRGAETLRAVHQNNGNNSFVQIGIEIAESHHEKWDGSGYPYGLKGNAIPLSGRILALVDVYDALRSKRCYKESFSHEKSRAIIQEGEGKHFDPDIVSCFLEIENDFDATWKNLSDDE
ncbi:MAG: HD domain-containing protein [Gallionellaceae bacterium]|nr:MAG: HD domain-containing protein [Gallionellaceae bacterium]